MADPVPNDKSAQAFREVGLGIQVDKAAATLPQSTTADLFTISGGRVLVAQVLGEVTVAIQNQANNTKLISHPDAGSDVDVCATADVANREVGAKAGITGLLSDALSLGNAGAVAGQLRPVILAPGKLRLSCSASNTGSMKWSLWYFPLDSGARVASA